MLMRLSASSDPGAVNLDQARRLLEERVVLTTAVVSELQRCDGSYSSDRPRAALNLLRRWVGERYEANIETHPGDGLDDMLLPEGAEDLMAELRTGAEICEALAMLWTADTMRELEGDKAAIRTLLASYPY
jgi:hypothetical protein